MTGQLSEGITWTTYTASCGHLARFDSDLTGDGTAEEWRRSQPCVRCQQINRYGHVPTMAEQTDIDQRAEDEGFALMQETEA